MNINISIKKQAIYVLVGILVLAGFLRLYKLGQQSFIADEYLGVNIAHGYNQSGQWKFWDFNQGKLTDEVYTRANVYYWQVAQMTKVLGENEFSGRLVSVGWGMVGIILVFCFSYFLFKKTEISLLAALLMAVSITALTYDRKLRMYAMFGSIYLLLSYWIFQFLESQPADYWRWLKNISQKTQLNWYYFPLVVLAVGLAFKTHLLTVNIFPVMAIYFLVMALIHYRDQKQWLSKYSIFFLLALLGFVGIFQIEVVRAGVDFRVFNFSYLEKVAWDYSNYVLTGSLLIFGAYSLIKKQQKPGIWITVNFLVPLLLAIFVWHRNAGHQYIYFIHSFKYILMAAAIYYSSDFIAKKIDFLAYKKAFIIITVYFLAVLINMPFFFSADSFYQDYTKWTYPNYKQAYTYYLKHRQSNDLLITRKLTFYYIKDSHSNVLTYADGNPLTLAQIQKAQEIYPQIWMIATKDSFIKGDAQKYIEDNFELIETSYTNNVIKIWRWDKKSKTAFKK